MEPRISGITLQHLLAGVLFVARGHGAHYLRGQKGAGSQMGTEFYGGPRKKAKAENEKGRRIETVADGNE